MGKHYYIFVMLLLIAASCYAQKNQSANDYFGSAVPGFEPRLFAEGIISTEFRELKASYSQDGNMFLYSVAS